MSEKFSFEKAKQDGWRVQVECVNEWRNARLHSHEPDPRGFVYVTLEYGKAAVTKLVNNLRNIPPDTDSVVNELRAQLADAEEEADRYCKVWAAAEDLLRKAKADNAAERSRADHYAGQLLRIAQCVSDTDAVRLNAGEVGDYVKATLEKREQDFADVKAQSETRGEQLSRIYKLVNPANGAADWRFVEEVGDAVERFVNEHQ